VWMKNAARCSTNKGRSFFTGKGTFRCPSVRIW
jgi:hypothetical protein